jgi:hypothetical protein
MLYLYTEVWLIYSEVGRPIHNKAGIITSSLNSQHSGRHNRVMHFKNVVYCR